MDRNVLSQEQSNLSSHTQSDGDQAFASQGMASEQSDRLIHALARLERLRLLCIAKDHGIPIALPPLTLPSNDPVSVEQAI